jgi:hypothetical protein
MSYTKILTLLLSVFILLLNQRLFAQSASDSVELFVKIKCRSYTLRVCNWLLSGMAKSLNWVFMDLVPCQITKSMAGVVKFRVFMTQRLADLIYAICEGIIQRVLAYVPFL